MPEPPPPSPCEPLGKINGFPFLNFQLDYSPNGNNWNEVQTNRVLGAYYWLHWTTQIPGGVLAKRYGTKLVFGVANFAVSAMCFIVPIAAYWDINALIAMRMIQGLIAVGLIFRIIFQHF